jgi:putative protein-disulfide isomerase
MVSVSYYTDPLCPWSWGIEPSIRKLMIEFGQELEWTFVMGGLARDVLAPRSQPAGVAEQQVYARLIREWLFAADQTRMPYDPLLWVEGPVSSSYPACMAVTAAGEQGADAAGRYLRRLREGLMTERRKLDGAEALVEEARGAGLDVERFRLDLRSHAITEAFGEDLERCRELASRAPEPAGPSSRGAGDVALPAIVFGSGEAATVVAGMRPYDDYRDAALAAGAGRDSGPPPSAEQLVARFGRVATREVEVVCELPGPRAGAELFRLAEQWRLRPHWRMTGYLWEAA